MSQTIPASPTAPAVRYSEPLAGPWQAVLTDHLGYVYPTVTDAREALGPTAVVYISVVRGSALPQPVDGGGAVTQVPEAVTDGDVAYEVGCQLVDDADMPPAGPAARYAQAQAAAHGLNLAGLPVVTVVTAGDVL